MHAHISKSRSFIVSTLTLTLIVIVLSGCARKPAPQPARPPAEVEVYTTAENDVPVTFTYIGQAEANQDVEVRARVQGVIWDIGFQEGTSVTAGQFLFRIDPRPFEADLQIAEAQSYQAKVAVDAARRDLDRTRKLQASASVSQEELDNALSKFETAVASQKLSEANVVKARLELSYTTVTAPIAGLVGKALKRPGDLVDTNDNSLLCNISAQDPMFIEFTVSEKDLLQYRRDVSSGHILAPEQSDYKIRIQMLDKSYYAQEGRINFSDVKIDPQTGTAEVRAVIANPDGFLKPGQFLQVHVLGARRTETVMVPQRAVMQGMQGSYVYVVGSDSKVEMRPVTASGWEGRNWIIESGLDKDEQVIIAGTNKTAPGSPVKVTTVTKELDMSTTSPVGR